ncbi:MAG: DUF4350 domain-containing protein [Mucilaginibacter polytrichastri]|nr:DUF4350 domain-containing protein [Mucilaginibacter polytrichastri]
MKNCLLLFLLFITGTPCCFAQQKTVLLDHYFNHEQQEDKASGKMVDYHYLWTETDLNGFSIFGEAFTKNGVKTALLDNGPDADNLKAADIYIIVDPDTKKENPDPKFMGPEHIGAIEKWVKAGGVLVLMANDSTNTELEHFNRLAARFGIHFLPELSNHVEGDRFEQGAIPVPPGHAVFRTAKKLFMKDIAALKLSKTAKPLLKKGDEVIMATVRYGKGTVFAVGDPWLYNEYVDGKRLPPEFQNREAAHDLVKWLVQRTRPKS